MIAHLQILNDVFQDEVAAPIIRNAVSTVRRTQYRVRQSSSFTEGPHGPLRETILEKLMERDKQGAIAEVHRALDQGLPLDELYLDALQPVLYRIGYLWHKGELTVGREHYVTAAIQGIISGWYARYSRLLGRSAQWCPLVRILFKGF